MSSFKLSPWTSDPRAIPKVVWLYIAENEILIAPNPIFGNLSPYLREKKVLRYHVLIHLRRLAEFDQENLTPPNSPPSSDDDDSGRRNRMTPLAELCTGSMGSHARMESLPESRRHLRMRVAAAGGRKGSSWNAAMTHQRQTQ